MQAQPSGEAGFVQIGDGQGEHVVHAVVVIRTQRLSVEFREQRRGDEGRALVAIDEGGVRARPKA